MKVAVDARMYKMSGIGTYIQNLIKNDCYQIALGNKEELENINELENIIEFNSPIYGIKEQLEFPYRELKKLKPDILHVPHYNVPIFYRGDMIVTIHDLTHLVYSEFLSSKFAKYYAKLMMWIAIKKAKIVLVESENTKNDLLKYFKIDKNKIKVVYLGVKEDIEQKPKEELNYLYKKFNISKDKKILMYVRKSKTSQKYREIIVCF